MARFAFIALVLVLTACNSSVVTQVPPGKAAADAQATLTAVELSNDATRDAEAHATAVAVLATQNGYSAATAVAAQSTLEYAKAQDELSNRATEIALQMIVDDATRESGERAAAVAATATVARELHQERVDNVRMLREDEITRLKQKRITNLIGFVIVCLFGSAVALAIIINSFKVGNSIVQRVEHLNNHPMHQAQNPDGSPSGLVVLPGLTSSRVIEMRRQPRLEAVYTAPEEPPVVTQISSGRINLPETLLGNQVGLGKAANGDSLWYTQSQLSDLLIVGNKGSGKSSFLRMIAYQAYMHGWHLNLADAEALTFNEDIWGGVAIEEGDVLDMLSAINDEFERRFKLYRQAFTNMKELPRGQQFFVEDLAAYNRAAQMFGMQSLNPMMLLWDEANSHLGYNTIRKRLPEIVRRSRKPGMTVVIAGHEWHAQSIPKIISGRLDRRVAFRTDEQSSRIILRDPMASRIPEGNQGLMLMRQKSGHIGPVKTFYLPASRILRDVRPFEQDRIVRVTNDQQQIPAGDLDGDGDEDVLILPNNPLQNVPDYIQLLAGKLTTIPSDCSANQAACILFDRERNASGKLQAAGSDYAALYAALYVRIYLRQDAEPWMQLMFENRPNKYASLPNFGS